ncbi:hypothetical protein B0H14DRAFT_3700010 [Mycena olivaceomarginata]|nr:hypothetical protein B0H14DRAFT_3700010 [Mycena olivaceomarginata]
MQWPTTKSIASGTKTGGKTTTSTPDTSKKIQCPKKEIGGNTATKSASLKAPQREDGTTQIQGTCERLERERDGAHDEEKRSSQSPLRERSNKGRICRRETRDGGPREGECREVDGEVKVSLRGRQEREGEGGPASIDREANTSTACTPPARIGRSLRTMYHRLPSILRAAPTGRQRVCADLGLRSHRSVSPTLPFQMYALPSYRSLFPLHTTGGRGGAVHHRRATDISRHPHTEPPRDAWMDAAGAGLHQPSHIASPDRPPGAPRTPPSKSFSVAARRGSNSARGLPHAPATHYTRTGRAPPCRREGGGGGGCVAGVALGRSPPAAASAHPDTVEERGGKERRSERKHRTATHDARQRLRARRKEQCSCQRGFPRVSRRRRRLVCTGCGGVSRRRWLEEKPRTTRRPHLPEGNRSSITDRCATQLRTCSTPRQTKDSKSRSRMRMRTSSAWMVGRAAYRRRYLLGTEWEAKCADPDSQGLVMSRVGEPDEKVDAGTTYMRCRRGAALRAGGAVAGGGASGAWGRRWRWKTHLQEDYRGAEQPQQGDVAARVLGTSGAFVAQSEVLVKAT